MWKDKTFMVIEKWFKVKLSFLAFWCTVDFTGSTFDFALLARTKTKLPKPITYLALV